MPSRTELKLELAFPYEIHITPTVNGGCIVNVGCAQLSYQTPARMLTDLKKYLAEPEKYEKAYNECNKTRGGNALVEREARPSLVAGSGRTVEAIPEDTEQSEPAQERAAIEGEETQESPG